MRRQTSGHAAFALRNQQIARFERTKKTLAASLVLPSPGPQLDGLALVDPLGDQNPSYLPVIDVAILENEQRQILRVMFGHPALDANHYAACADTVRAACRFGEPIISIDGFVVIER